MKEKLTFIGCLVEDLLTNAKIYARYKEAYDDEAQRYRDRKVSAYPLDMNYMNKNHGKVALKRKITYLRQELLNLERML